MIGESDVRPWGTWTTLDEGDGFKVKRIEVNAHSRLSYQTHEHRSEHWAIVSGQATCVVDGQILTARAGESIDVELGQPHRITNQHDEPLVLIEVQMGAYTGEDDIVRLEDDYGRAALEA